MCPSLIQLTLNENEISECDLRGHETLKQLSLVQNKLKSLDGLENLPSLEILTIEFNPKLTSISGLKNMPCLKTLNLKANKIELQSAFPILPVLEVLNIDQNPI